MPNETKDQELHLKTEAFSLLNTMLQPCNRHYDHARSMTTDGKFRLLLLTPEGHKIWIADADGYLNEKVRHGYPGHPVSAIAT